MGSLGMHSHTVRTLVVCPKPERKIMKVLGFRVLG